MIDFVNSKPVSVHHQILIRSKAEVIYRFMGAKIEGKTLILYFFLLPEKDYTHSIPHINRLDHLAVFAIWFATPSKGSNIHRPKSSPFS
jgi:hypothetical protein